MIKKTIVWFGIKLYGLIRKLHGLERNCMVSNHESYGLGRVWGRQVCITWNNIDQSVSSCGIHMQAVSQRVSKLIFCIITLLWLQLCLPEANELIFCLLCRYCTSSNSSTTSPALWLQQMNSRENSYSSRYSSRWIFFRIWHKWSLAGEGVSCTMTFDLDLYLLRTFSHDFAIKLLKYCIACRVRFTACTILGGFFPYLALMITGMG